ncbi:SusE domain-containing protein [Mangrovimonas aestuarii]|uniref:SusE domain-containing protein n=1 Tax=Mangrovimonas aestuarii TaxID=3018443 RepID=UPI002378FACC|nr:SusE domain-containing protein [Mangrovimonas aestuarii]
MKNIKLLGLILIAFASLWSCEDDDTLDFVAAPQEGFMLTNSTLEEYILTQETSSNIGERFTWNNAEFEAPTNVNYTIEYSILGDFSDAIELDFTSTSGNEAVVSIGDMWDIGIAAGLSEDPDTGLPNTGDIYFRAKAAPGSGTVASETYTDPQTLTVVLFESTGEETFNCEYDQLWGVGAGLPDAGWGWSTPVNIPCSGDGIYGGNVVLQNNGGADNNFRFFTEEENWGSGLNYPYFTGEGYTIDENFVDAMDGDNNFAFIGATGLYYLQIDTNAKTITLSDPVPTGECEYETLYGVGAGLPTAGWGWSTPVQVICSGDGVYSNYVEFTSDGDANFRFFTEYENWGSGLNYPYFTGEGYTIDENLIDAADGDNNFKFIGVSGIYLFTIDTVNKVISLE